MTSPETSAVAGGLTATALNTVNVAETIFNLVAYGCVTLAGAWQSGGRFRQRLLTPDGVDLSTRKTGRPKKCLRPSS